MTTVETFSKDQYMMIIREKRREFVHKMYPQNLKKIFRELRENALEGKNCHYEASFNVEPQYNIDSIQMYLLQYFQDEGYQPIVEPRKSDSSQIKLTLT